LCFNYGLLQMQHTHGFVVTSFIHIIRIQDLILKYTRTFPEAIQGRRKVRTPEGAMPRNWPGRRKKAGGEIHAGDDAVRRPDGQCHRNLNRPGLGNEAEARVKRWGKSPPPHAQARGHGKPHRVQGQIGDPEAARFMFRTTERVPGIGC